MMRESAKGQDGIHGYIEKPEVGRIKGKIRDFGGNSVTGIGLMSNVSVVVSLTNGKSAIGTGMWLTELGEVSGEDGSLDFTFESGSVIEA
jgi:Phage tail tube protein